MRDKIPEIMVMKPKEMRRAWAIFMADQDWGHGESWVAAEQVRLAIDMLAFNEGRDSELWALKQVEQQLADFVVFRSRYA